MGRALRDHHVQEEQLTRDAREARKTVSSVDAREVIVDVHAWLAKSMARGWK